MFLMNNIKMHRILTKIFYIGFQVLKVLLIKICKILCQICHQIFYLLFDQLLYQRIYFSTNFRTSFKIICRKDFRRKFSFFNGFTETPTLHLNSQNPLSVTKVFCQCSLTCLGFSRLLCYNDVGKNYSRTEPILQSNFNPKVHGSWWLSSDKPLDSDYPKRYMVEKLLQEAALNAVLILVNGQNIFCSGWENNLSD